LYYCVNKTLTKIMPAGFSREYAKTKLFLLKPPGESSGAQQSKQIQPCASERKRMGNKLTLGGVVGRSG